MRVNILEDKVLNMKLKYKYLYLNRCNAENLFMTTAISMTNSIIAQSNQAKFSNLLEIQLYEKEAYKKIINAGLGRKYSDKIR